MFTPLPMPKKRWIENENIDPVHLDTTTWPLVHEDKLDSKDRNVFRIRKKAVDLYMKNEEPLHEITRITGIDRKEIRKYVKQCLSHDGIGGIWGYRALIPRIRLRSYQRQSLPKFKKEHFSNMIGSFTLLLKTYPKIQETIENLYLGRNQKEVRAPLINSTENFSRYVLTKEPLLINILFLLMIWEEDLYIVM